MFAYVGVPKAASLGKYHSANSTFTAQFQTYTHVGHTMTIWWEHLTSMVPMSKKTPAQHFYSYHSRVFFICRVSTNQGRGSCRAWLDGAPAVFQVSERRPFEHQRGCHEIR